MAVASYMVWHYALLSGERSGDRPLPVPSGAKEIAWLAPATSSLDWQRMVSAMELAMGTPACAGCTLDTSRAFPSRSSEIPECRVVLRGHSLIWRWYRLDESLHVADLLLQRKPPPLAMVGGNTSDAAQALADCMSHQRETGSGQLPILMLTTATANRLAKSDAKPGTTRNLMEIHPGLTFRMGFSNRRMASVILGFLKAQSTWGGPLPAPWLMQWTDDPYAIDLLQAFQGAWHNLPSEERAPAGPPLPITIASSVGGMTRPNADEEFAASLFVDRASRFNNLESNWMVLCGQILPTRRLLRLMSGQSDSRLRGMTVAAGDTLGFNTVYRDWQELWPATDLPFRVVFFCHENPVDESAGFVRDPAAAERHKATGTEDLLLNRDLAMALIAAWGEMTETDGPVEMAKFLHELRFQAIGPVMPRDTQLMSAHLYFDIDGERTPETGEHVVTLHPGSSKVPGGPGQVEVWSIQKEQSGPRYIRLRQMSQPVYRSNE